MSDVNLPGSDDEGIMGDEPPVREPGDDQADQIDQEGIDANMLGRARTPMPPD